MTEIRGRMADPAATDRLGRGLAPALKPGDAVCLIGALGAGKSALARAVITELLAADGRAEETPSPTYTLMQSYEAAVGEILHMDLYRLTPGADIAELGVEEAAEHAILLIEWPDRLGEETPERRIELELSTPSSGDGSGAGRLLTARFFGEDWAEAEAAIAAALEQTT